ncbi:TetR family transcriptional regulator [Mycobacterium paraintracellulare]|nr:TetR family transcriptional regulator [Mycobacterium paraintracellulare]
MCQNRVVQPSRTYRGATPSQRAEQRRARLIEAAVDVFGTVGYRAATVDQICAGAGLSKRYFYESFPGSESLLLACYQRCADEIHQAMVSAVAQAPADTLDAQLRAALKGYFEAIDADQKRARITLLEILGVGPAVDAAWAAETQRFAASVETLAPAAFTKTTLPKAQRAIIAEGIIGAITTAATLWLLQDRRRPRAQLINATHVLVLAVFDRLPNT